MCQCSLFIVCRGFNTWLGWVKDGEIVLLVFSELSVDNTTAYSKTAIVIQAEAPRSLFSLMAGLLTGTMTLKLLLFNIDQ